MGAEMVGRMIDVFGALQDGRIEVGLLSAAQVDRNGALNSTLVRSPKGQARRLPGSGGALDIALLANELIILMAHEKRRLVEKVDFVTSPGRAATKAHSQHIVTNLGSFAFSEGVISLDTFYDDVDPAAAAQFGDTAVDYRNAKPIPVPTKEEIRIFRTFADKE
jgi:glutaconate CoA-transferase subunit B